MTHLALLLLANVPSLAIEPGPVDASLVATLPPWAQIAIQVAIGLAALVGSIVGPSSLLANFLNNLVRAKRMAGEKPSAMLLAVAATINRTALNFSKASRLAKAARE